MALIGSRIYLAFDASCVTAASVAEGVQGPRLRRIAREPLPAGALVPGASAANLADAEAVRAAASRALAPLERGRVTLVLPEGLARIALVDAPRGLRTEEYVRYRLAPSLPWAAEHAVFEALAAGRGRAVGAAIRRATVAEYEQAAAAIGAPAEQVHLAPLLSVTGLLRRRGAHGLFALLGDVASCLALVQDGALVALRSRRRDRSDGEAGRLRAELLKLAGPGSNGNGSLPLHVIGTGALELRAQLGAVEAKATAPELHEAAWLAGVLG